MKSANVDTFFVELKILLHLDLMYLNELHINQINKSYYKKMTYIDGNNEPMLIDFF